MDLQRDLGVRGKVYLELRTRIIVRTSRAVNPDFWPTLQRFFSPRAAAWSKNCRTAFSGVLSQQICKKTIFERGNFQEWLKIWRAWRDLNSRHSEPESDALSGLSYRRTFSPHHSNESGRIVQGDQAFFFEDFSFFMSSRTCLAWRSGYNSEPAEDSAPERT